MEKVVFPIHAVVDSKGEPIAYGRTRVTRPVEGSVSFLTNGDTYIYKDGKWRYALPEYSDWLISKLAAIHFADFELEESPWGWYVRFRQWGNERPLYLGPYDAKGVALVVAVSHPRESWTLTKELPF